MLHALICRSDVDLVQCHCHLTSVIVLVMSSHLLSITRHNTGLSGRHCTSSVQQIHMTHTLKVTTKVSGAPPRRLAPHIRANTTTPSGEVDARLTRDGICRWLGRALCELMLDLIFMTSTPGL